MQTETSDEHLQLKMEEDILSSNVEKLLKLAKDTIYASQDSIADISVDLSKVSTIDSQGLNFLVGLYQECQGNGWGFQVTGASPALKRLFHFVKLNERFGIQTS